VKLEPTMISNEQTRLISSFKVDLVESLSEKQLAMIKSFWASLQPGLSPVQKMVVSEILKSIGV
jgi:hypothetical protein